jgi:SPX domain protein involved in polyphosphate accumulation
MILSEESIRQEIKYKVFIKDINHLYSWLIKKSFMESYPDRAVSSLYYDTDDFNFASSNMSGESQRIKVRTRWYSNKYSDLSSLLTNNTNHYTFEVKRKKNSLSDKLVIGKSEPCSFITSNQLIAYLNSELEKFKKNYPPIINLNLREAVFINYQREYFEYSLNRSIRITIDSCIHYSKVAPNIKSCLLSKDYFIVELKYHPDVKDEVVKVMHNFPFRQVRSSKFLAGLAQLKNVSY